MLNFRVNHLILILISIFLIGISVAFIIDRDFGNINVKIISIPNNGKQISGLLYIPNDATFQNPKPAIVLTHGISGSKQMLSGIALELARYGFVSLTIDLIGHGNSEGIFGSDNLDLTLGTLAAVEYLHVQPYTSSFIGLVGHSVGAGAIRATTIANVNISASVYIAGGLGGMTAGSEFGSLNSTFPKNLLIIIGKYDVLFDIDKLEKELQPVFGISQKIVPDIIYGNFSTGTARKIITPPTTHLFEPMDLSIVSEIVHWMNNVFKIRSNNSKNFEISNYFYREIAISISFFSFVGLIYPLYLIIIDFFPSLIQREKITTKYGILESWKTSIIWGILGLALLLPMFLIGSLISIPPLIFGSSFAWWLLAIGIVGLLLIILVFPKFSNIRLNLIEASKEAFNYKSLAAAIILFIFLYSIVYITESISFIDLRIFVIPVFNNLIPFNRIIVFFLFVPFFVIFFFVEGLYFHEFYNGSSMKSGKKGKIVTLIKILCAKIFPYIILLMLNYVPMIFFNIRLLPLFIGFLMEFFWGVMPLFIISIICSWLIYQKTSNVGTGAIINSFLFAWSAASVFPFGASLGFMMS